MSRTIVPKPSRPSPLPDSSAGLCVRFVEVSSLTSTKPDRRFVDPLPMIAVTESIDSAKISTAKSWPEPTDELLVHFTSRDEIIVAIEPALAPPDHPDAPRPITIALSKTKLHWRPGVAVLSGAMDDRQEILAALIDFAFYEGQLRKLENALLPFESKAREESQHTYVIKSNDKNLWPGFNETIQNLAMLRMTYARLEPRLLRPSRSMSAASRTIFAKLARRADIEDRLDAATERLEVLEELYEAAVDRVTDYRWYRRGANLEIAIIVLLVIEVMQISAELVLHFMENRHP